LQRLAFQDPDLKYFALRALVSYVRSVHLHHDKAIFKVEGLPVEALAVSLGLPGAPKIGLLRHAQAKERKNAPHAPAAQSEDEEDLHSGSADNSGEHRSDVEVVGTSQDELPPAKEQER
jgi:ATP-dependent RNA helicase DDX10/DBP4